MSETDWVVLGAAAATVASARHKNAEM
jgi:hypothetical protein